MISARAKVFLLVMLTTELCQSLGCNSKKCVKHTRNISCKNHAAKPNFDKKKVIGKLWRIYYSWNLDLKTTCIDFTARNATDAITERIMYYMSPYLEDVPEHGLASLYSTVGPTKRGLLLFKDGKVAGNFIAVPNLSQRDLDWFDASHRFVELYKVFLKLVHSNKYLLIMDCKEEVAALLTRDFKPNRKNLVKVAGSLGLSEGAHACVSDTENEEKRLN